MPSVEYSSSPGRELNTASISFPSEEKTLFTSRKSSGRRPFPSEMTIVSLFLKMPPLDFELTSATMRRASLMDSYISQSDVMFLLVSLM